MVRFFILQVDDTDRIEDKYWNPGARYRPPWDTKYITYGFAYIQDMIEHAYITEMTAPNSGLRDPEEVSECGVKH